MALAATSAAWASAPLAPPVGYPAGDGPAAMAAADFDGDGDVDLAVADLHSGQVSVLSGDGAGGFAPTGSYMAAAADVAAADLDGDGDVDLAVADSDPGSGANGVSVLVGQGDGTFVAAGGYPVDVAPLSVAAADLDGDGDVDLATANSGSATVSVLLGLGEATFARAASYPVGDVPTSVAAADLDGDGTADLAVTNQASDDVSVLAGRGDGTFAPAASYDAGPSGPFAVQASDLDGDGDADLAVANLNSDQVSVLAGRGDGTFASASSHPVGDAPFAVAVADLDGDGTPDLVSANFDSDDISVLVGRGGAAFAPAVSYPAGDTPRSVTVADLDRDGYASDLAVANFDADAVSVLLALPVISVEPTGVEFGWQPVGTVSDTRSVTLTNTGWAPLEVAQASLTGSAAFAIAADRCSATTLAPGRSCSVDVSFAPTTFGRHDAGLTLTDDPAGSLGLFGSGGVAVLSGPSRIQTAVQASRDGFGDGAAGAVVLARADDFPDALAGTPLAVRRDGPLLLTMPDRLHPATSQEIQRVLPRGATVILLGDHDALSPAVADAVAALGYPVQRVAGATRFETAVAVAQEIGAADAVLLSSGLDFPDALTAGAAAPQIDAVVLLSNGTQPHQATLQHLADRGGPPQFAIGGPAVAAHPSATPVAGASRYETAAQVARTFFADPALVGVASGQAFPDALTGAAHIGRRGGPLLLTARYFLPAATWAYLHEHAASVAAAYVYGGPVAVDDTARSAIPTAFQPNQP